MLRRSMTLARQLFDSMPTAQITGYTLTKTIQLKSRQPRVTPPTQPGFDPAEFWVVEGDLLLDEDEVALYALVQLDDSPAPSYPIPESTLIGITVDSQPAKWDDGTILTYAVLERSFPDASSYRLARDALAQAAADWEAICDVRFEHLKHCDGSSVLSPVPTAVDPDLMFLARYYDSGGKFHAASFLPTQPDARRNVYFDPQFFEHGPLYEPRGVMRHELGHVLGFRHEHIRTGAPPVCPQEDARDLVKLGDYDPQSVMHYFCGGVGNPRLEFTEGDVIGARLLYGPPLPKD